MTPHPLFDLSGRVALVTGASRGIGAGIAHLLAEHGAHIVVSSRRIEGCEAVAEAIRAKGLSADSLACHIGDMDAIDAVIGHIEATHGRLDILVNNAATNPYFGHILDTDPGSFQKTLDVNIRGYFFMSVAAGKLMRAQGKGAIVNTASVNALEPGDGQGTYSLTKAAVVNMTQAFAKECAPLGIRVNAIAPGWTRTKFAGALLDSQPHHDAIMARLPMKRPAEPEEMAGAVLYLVSDAASYTTGELLVVDGGLTI